MIIAHVCTCAGGSATDVSWNLILIPVLSIPEAISFFLSFPPQKPFLFASSLLPFLSFKKNFFFMGREGAGSPRL